MSIARNERGFSLFDFTLTIAIATIMLPILGGVIYMLQLLPDRAESDVITQQDLQLLAKWITDDSLVRSANAIHIAETIKLPRKITAPKMCSIRCHSYEYKGSEATTAATNMATINNACRFEALRPSTSTAAISIPS